MTKQDLAAQISHDTAINQKIVLDVLDSMINVTKKALSQGQEVTLRGFGTFKGVERKEKIARNITRGTEIIIPAHRAPVFKASREFKEMLK